MKILENIQRNYPGLTLVSVTQKIASVEEYDQIILLMQGEINCIGKHEELLQQARVCADYSIHKKVPATMNYNLNALTGDKKKSTYSALTKVCCS